MSNINFNLTTGQSLASWLSSGWYAARHFEQMVGKYTSSLGRVYHFLMGMIDCFPIVGRIASYAEKLFLENSKQTDKQSPTSLKSRKIAETPAHPSIEKIRLMEEEVMKNRELVEQLNRTLKETSDEKKELAEQLKATQKRNRELVGELKLTHARALEKEGLKKQLDLAKTRTDLEVKEFNKKLTIISHLTEQLSSAEIKNKELTEQLDLAKTKVRTIEDSEADKKSLTATLDQSRKELTHAMELNKKRQVELEELRDEVRVLTGNLEDKRNSKRHIKRRLANKEKEIERLRTELEKAKGAVGQTVQEARKEEIPVEGKEKQDFHSITNRLMLKYKINPPDNLEDKRRMKQSLENKDKNASFSEDETSSNSKGSPPTVPLIIQEKQAEPKKRNATETMQLIMTTENRFHRKTLFEDHIKNTYEEYRTKYASNSDFSSKLENIYKRLIEWMNDKDIIDLNNLSVDDCESFIRRAEFEFEQIPNRVTKELERASRVEEHPVDEQVHTAYYHFSNPALAAQPVYI